MNRTKMEKNRKLRLLVTSDCPNACPLCCNKQFDIKDIPVVDNWNYEEIMITGGEPLLYPNRLEKLCKAIREVTEQMGSRPKIYLYTARPEWSSFERAVNYYADGIVVAPHSVTDIKYFRQTNNNLLKYRYGKYLECSLRLKVFPEVKDALPENLKCWKVEQAEWIENCPLPVGEDFRRIAELWNKDKW